MVWTRCFKALLNPPLLSWMKLQTPRLYVFEKDEPIPWEAVRQRAEAAKTSSLNIHCEVYEESALVAHVRLDPKRYRTSIEDLLEIVHRESQVKATQNIVGSSVGVTDQNLVQLSMMSMLVIRSLVTWAYLDKKSGRVYARPGPVMRINYHVAHHLQNRN